MSKNGKKYKILNIKIDNFLCLKSVEIKPNSKLNIFFGKNRQGKTDIIEALKFLFKGAADEDIINIDADKAQVLVDLGKYKIKRTKTRKSGTLTVETDDGDVKKQPQTFLDVLIGTAFTFDPFAFLLLKDKELKKYLLDLFEVKITPEMLEGKIDKETMKLLDFTQDGFTVLKNAATIFYTQRTSINKQAAVKKALFADKMRQCEGFLPEEYKSTETQEAYDVLSRMNQELSNAQLLSKQAEEASQSARELREKITSIDLAMKEIDTVGFAQLDALENECATLKEDIRLLQEVLDGKINEYDTIKEAKETYSSHNEKLLEAEKTLEILPTESKVPDIPTIEAKIEGAKERVTSAEAQDELHNIYTDAQEGIKVEYLAFTEDAKKLTDTIEYFKDTLPQKLTKDANIPIKGLSFDGDKVMIGDKALKYMSTSERVGIAMQIIRELNKDVKLPLLCLDRAESLDNDTLSECAKQIEKDGFQYFFTSVQHGDTVPKEAFHVENGNVSAPKASEEQEVTV